jgi:hypothetical protein
VPERAWLTKVAVDVPAGGLDFDLAIDASGAGKPSAVDAGYAPFRPNPAPRAPIALYLLAAAVLVVAVPLIGSRIGRGLSGGAPLAGA